VKAATPFASLLTACILSISAAAQTVDSPRSPHSNNRYLAVLLGQSTQNYREQDQQGLTQDGLLNRESGKQNSLSLALRWQFDSHLVVDLAAQRQSGATDYSGYLQAGNGSLSPYSARTGNVATQYSASMGYALNAANWALLPAAWQITPLLQLFKHHWQRNLAQYSEVYRHRAQATGIRLAWEAAPNLTLEAQAMYGKTSPANVSVPDFAFDAQQSAGEYQQQHLSAAYTLAQGWRLQAKYEQSRYSHGASPVVNGLQAPPNEHRPSSWGIGLQKLF
jgi:hypothetical protein